MADAQENALLSGYREQYQQDIERRREKEQQNSADALEWRKGELNEVRQAAFDAAIKVGASPAKAKIAAMAPDFIPGVGEGLAARDVAQSLERNDYIGAGIYGLAGVAGAIPGVGDVAGQTLRAGARKLRDIRDSGKKGIAAKSTKPFDENTASLEEIRAEYKVSQRQEVDPELAKGAKQIAEGKSGKEEAVFGPNKNETWDELVQRKYPPTIMAEVPKPASPRRIEAVLGKKAEKGILGNTVELVKLVGEKVSVRLDIPSYNNYNTWIPTIHKFRSRGTPGNVLAYAPAISIKNVVFHTPDLEKPVKKALAIAQGGQKNPYAGMEGLVVNRSVDDTYNLAKKQLADPKSEWIQIGMNPRGHSYFIDNATGQPVLSAEEVIQVGKLVLARGAKKGKSSDFEFEQGGINIDNNDSKFQKGGTNMSDVDMYKGDMEDQMMLSGLVSEPDDVDPVSGNEIPLGATAEGVRDDETVSISPGEFVIPDYAVRYHGIDFYMESLQKAKQGLQQMEQMGMVGNPDNATMPEEAPLPTMDTEDQPSMATEDEPPEFQTGGLTTVALPQVPQQQAILQAPILTQPTVAGQATQPVTQPVSSTITQPLRPISTQPVPVAPTFGQLQPQAPTYTASQGPTAGLPGGYSIEEFVNDAGNSIFLTTIGGQVTGGVPPGYRKVGTDNLGYAQPYTQPSGFDLSDIGDTAEGAATALGALTAFNTLNKATDGKLLEGGVKLLESIPGGKELVNFAKETGGNISELITGIFKQGTDDILKATGIPDMIAGEPSTIFSTNVPPSAPVDPAAIGAEAIFDSTGQVSQGVQQGLGSTTTPNITGDTIATTRKIVDSQRAASSVATPSSTPTATTTPEFQSLIKQRPTQQLPGPDVITQTIPQAVTSLTVPHTAVTAGRVLSAALAAPTSAATKALAAGLNLPVAKLGTVAAAKQAAGIANFMNASGAAGATTAAGTGFGAALAGAAPFLIPAAIMALPTISNMISGSSNRVQAGRQATNKVQELLFSTTFNETNAQRIRALAGIKGDKGQYGEVPSEGQVSSLSSTLGGIDNLGGIEAIPTAAGRELYKILKAESSRRILESKREAITTDADDADRTRQYTPEQVEREYRERMSGAGSVKARD
mgnify:FL=1